MKGVLYLTLISFILGILIVVLNRFINYSKVEDIKKLLPGYNCGSCGFGSCIGLAQELLNNKDSINKCRFIKNKEEILKKIK